MGQSQDASPREDRRQVWLGHETRHHPKEQVKAERFAEDISNANVLVAEQWPASPGHQHHRDRAEIFKLPEPSKEGPSIHHGHQDVQQDEAGCPLLHEVKGCLAIASRPHVIPVIGECHYDHRRDETLVFDDQDTWSRKAVLTATHSPLYAAERSKGSAASLYLKAACAISVATATLDDAWGAEQMRTTEPQVFRSGQQVRIIACPQDHPDHVGQVGTVFQRYNRTTTIRVHVGTGICQATAVEAVPVETPPPVKKPNRWPSTRTPPGAYRAAARSLDIDDHA
jgi:hypothetical protein